MQNYLKKPLWLGVCITAMKLMELSEKKKYLTSKHKGPMLNKPTDDVKPLKGVHRQAQKDQRR